MNTKNQRSFNAFTQLVNTKIDPIVQCGWIKKINRKKHSISRFFVATKSALFICKSSGIMRTLKIAHIHAWVDLSSFEMSDSHSSPKFTFNFGENASASFFHEDPNRFVTPILTSIQSILPPHFHSRLHIPSTLKIDTASTRPSQFLYLFISSCRSLDSPINDNFCASLRKTLYQKHPIVLIQENYDTTLLSAFCRALSLTRTVKRVCIGGIEFHDLYGHLSDVLKANPTINELTIKNHNSSDGFVRFLRAISVSALKTLTFETVHFTNQMLQFFSEENSLQSVELDLSFINCNLEANQFALLRGTIEMVQKLQICKDDQPMPLDVIPGIFQTVKTSQITALSLKSMGIDVALVLKHLHMADLQLEILDLSGNFCSPLLTADYSLSPSLTTLKLKNVRWEEKTFILFLSAQSFSSAVAVNLSHAQFSGGFEELPKFPPSPMISKLKWNRNPLNPTILSFIEQYSFLEDVSFNNCEVSPSEDSDEILNSLALFLEKVHLSRFSIVGTLKKFKTRMMFALRSALIFHPTLKRLNVSDNAIGDDGLPILRDVIVQSESIVQVSFDSSEIQQPITMIQFLNEISDATHLLHLSKPRVDLQHLESKSAKGIQREIKEAWANLESKIQKNTEIVGADTDLYSINSTFNSTVADSVSMFDAGPITWIEASWDIDIDLGYDGSEGIWEMMKAEYAVDAITGFQEGEQKETPLIKEDISNTEQSDLIDYEPV